MGVSNLGDLVATAQLDISPFMNNTRQLQLYTRSLDNSLKTLETSFKGQKDKLSRLKATYTQTGHSLKGYQELLKKQTEHYNNLKDEIGDVSSATSEQKNQLVGAQSAMTATAARVAELQNKYNALAREIATQSSLWTKLGTNLTQSGKELKTFGDATAGVGKALTAGLTVPIMAGAGYAVKAAVQYESAFAGVKKTVDETATTSYEKLSKNIRQLSKELPASAVEIANVAEIAGQLGIRADNITDFTKVMIDLGESTNMSATIAAESLAKFANITKLAPENYGRLGASIVELGNNFATTEADITAMASRLAGAGAQIGLSQADIVGLSAALSSVGIEAEMGGSAFSKMMVKMQLAVTSGSKGMDELTAKTGVSRREFELMLANSPKDFKKLADSIGMTSTEMSNIVKASANLEDFARISGMTADEFVQKFEKDAVGAIGAFINGLGNAEESGESAIEMLNEMGFSEVRLRDSLLRAGNAQDLFTKAVNMSSKAWSENSALTKEANKRYETTESKLKMLRNEVTDVAIEFGGPLVDALRDGLEASEPIIQSAVDLAKAFSKLDKEQQQQIISWGLIAATSGPALNVLGKGIGVTGSIFNGLGKVSTALGKVSGALQTGQPLLSAFASSTATATTNASTFGGTLGLLSNPIGLTVAGVATLTAGLLWLNNEKDRAREKVEEWGVTLDSATRNELETFKTKVDDTRLAVETFGKNGATSVEEVKQAFTDLMDEITATRDEANARLDEIGQKLGLTTEQIARGKENNDRYVSNARKMTEEIQAIYDRHNGAVDDLTSEELAIVENNQRELINVKLSLMELSNEEELAVRKAFNDDLAILNETQLKKTMASLEEALSAEKKAYDEELSLLKESLDSKMLNQEEYNAKREQAEKEHNTVMDVLGKKYAEAAAERDAKANARLRDFTTNNQQNIEKAQVFLNKLGLSYEELSKKVDIAAEKGAKGSELLALSTANMTEEMKQANALWTAIVFDEKTGQVKTNAVEEIKKAVVAKENWNSLSFMLQNANLTSNARVVVAEALTEAGRWKELTVEEKKLVVDGHLGIQAIFDSTENLKIWNSMPAEVKELLASNEQFLATEESAETALINWNNLTAEQKELYASNLTAKGTESAQMTINSLIGKTVPLNVINATGIGVFEAQTGINSVQQRSVPSILVDDKASSAAAGIREQIYSIPTYRETLIKAIYDGPQPYASGTNFHPGGLAVVNDQKGSLYRELITLPTGDSFIPEGRNIVFPLPRGTKVLKASDTKKIFPHYANGIGFEDTGISNIANRIQKIRKSGEVMFSKSAKDTINNKLESLLNELLNWLTNNKNDQLVQQALSVAEKTAKRPQYMMIETGALIGAIGDDLSRYQSPATIIDNMLERRKY
ncbi:TPA: phage tail tape measure protein [Streptococcus suis]